MPFSQSSQISTIVQYIEENNPTSMLDVGTGMGQYGFLARTNLEQVNLFKINGSNAKQRSKQDWRVRIDGIEGCDIYITPVHDYCYNEMMIGDALKILPDLPDNSYELVLAIDILEHFDNADGLIFLSHLKRISSKAALVSTPKEFVVQEVAANPYENHRSLWSENELAENDFTKFLHNDISLIAVCEC